MGQPLIRYRSIDEDSSRWSGFEFRDGDIVISTRSKHGTTWIQMVCALLIFQTPDLPGSLSGLSPWLDWLGEPSERVVARLNAQEHRRFIKTHTPLDGVPFDRRVSYVVVARHPLDAAVSLYQQGQNIDRDRVSQLTGQALTHRVEQPLHPWLLAWIDSQSDPSTALDSLAGVMHHLSDAWNRRTQPNATLVHYYDLSRDLQGSMRRLATRLGIDVPELAWRDLVSAATLDEMRSHADQLAPDALGIFKDRSQFFRHGECGEGQAQLSSGEQHDYFAIANELAPNDLLAWLHRP